MQPHTAVDITMEYMLTDISQTALARRHNRNKSTISRIVRGKVHPESHAVAMRRVALIVEANSKETTS